MEGSLVQKRPREDFEAQLEEKDVVFDEDCSSKRHKPYNHILSLLELEEEDSTQDLSPLITTLQKEINSCDSSNNDQNTLLMMNPFSQGKNSDHTSNNLEENSLSSIPLNNNKKEDDEDNEKERVMRHLLQASDDELGIPSIGEYDGSVLDLDFGEYGFGNNNNNNNNNNTRDGDYVNGDDGFSSLCDKLWEIEDEAANYYALLQSELFLWEQ